MEPVVAPDLARAVLYGVCSAVSVCLGKGLQKYGVEFIAHPATTWSERKFLKIFVWFLGTGGIVASAFFMFAAAAYGPISLLAALSGTGLVALWLFSTFVLKEPVGPAELTGIGFIIVGTVLAGWVDAWPALATYGLAAPAAGTMNVPNLVAFSLVVAALSVAAAAWSVRHQYRYFGVIFGSISGFCGGISIFYQKAAMLHCACADIFEDIPAALQNPFFYLFALTGVGDFLVTQVALTRAKAVTVVPCYQSWYLLVPVVGGVFCYYERFTLAQAAGVGLLGVGIVLVSTAVAKGVA